jgi:hypothetical protein
MYVQAILEIILRASILGPQKIEVSEFRTSKMGFENAQQTDNSCMLYIGTQKKNFWSVEVSDVWNHSITK